MGDNENSKVEPNNEQYKELKKDFFNKVARYLGYKNATNLTNVYNFTNSLNSNDFNQLIEIYFKEQGEKSQKPRIKEGLIKLYSGILEQRFGVVCESMENALATNLCIEKASIKENGKTFGLQGNKIERIGTGNMYAVELDFGERKTKNFQIKTEEKSVVVSDESGRLITNCHVEKLGGELKSKPTVMGIQSIHIEKHYRITIGNVVFTIKFND